MVKNPPANSGDTRDVGLTPGSGRSPGDRNGYPLQYSCLENSMARRAWQATVHRKKGIMLKKNMMWSPNFLAPGSGFMEGNFSTDRVGRKWFGCDLGTLH